MNWVIMPALNCLDLTKQSIASLQNQTIPTKIWVLNQGSTDGTREWLFSQPDLVFTQHYPKFRSLSACWNHALSFLFDKEQAPHVLVVNNDTLFRPETYEKLLAAPYPFVTAVGVRNREQFEAGTVHEDRRGVRSHPDFSCFLIRREVWQRVGRFDEHFIPAYLDDRDMHLRMTAAGINAVCIDLPFFHYASQTVKQDENALSEVKKWEKFREAYFLEKWGGPCMSETFKQPFGGKPHSCWLCEQKCDTPGRATAS